MADNPDNLVLEILRQLRGEISTIRNDTTAMRNELRDGFNRVEVRLSLIEQTLGSMLTVSASDRDEIRTLRQRVERIERRLELQD